MGMVVVARYRVLVNPRMSVSEGISRGKYDWVDADITEEHFPQEEFIRQKSVLVDLICYPSNTSTEAIKQDFATNKYRSSVLRTALAIGEQCPRAQSKGPIVFLGSHWRSPGGFVGVPVLDMNGRRRELLLEPHDVSWCSECLFAAEKV